MEAVFRALSDPIRRKILDLLRAGPRTTGEICEGFEITRFGVMKHLRVLQEAGLVIARKKGRQVHNHLNALPLREMYERWITPFESEWAGRLERLRRQAQYGGTMTPTMEPQAGGARQLHIAQEITIQASPSEVFRALTEGIGEWWGAPYLYDQEARDVVLEPRVGGLMREETSDGGAVAWATVVEIRPNRTLELSGVVGMRGAVAGLIRFELEEKNGGSLLKLDHRAVGDIEPEMEGNYQGGWNDLLATRLKGYVERGERSGVRAR
jgi:DNA-binding transcriptional ArsR family regulator/uncharacterized protein YndB with AHSA1/START domain